MDRGSDPIYSVLVLAGVTGILDKPIQRPVFELLINGRHAAASVIRRDVARVKSRLGPFIIGPLFVYESTKSTARVDQSTSPGPIQDGH
jgi:hypothetical protein